MTKVRLTPERIVPLLSLGLTHRQVAEKLSFEDKRRPGYLPHSVSTALRKWRKSRPS